MNWRLLFSSRARRKYRIDKIKAARVQVRAAFNKYKLKYIMVYDVLPPLPGKDDKQRDRWIRMRDRLLKAVQVPFKKAFGKLWRLGYIYIPRNGHFIPVRAGAEKYMMLTFYENLADINHTRVAIEKLRNT